MAKTVNFTGQFEDRVAIRELCDQYCDGVMSKDMEMWGNTWAERCEWVRFGQVFARDRAAVVAEAKKMLDGYTSGTFFCNIGRTHVNGEHATGRVYHVEVYFVEDRAEWYRTYSDDDSARWTAARIPETRLNDDQFGKILSADTFKAGCRR